jgi:hypothetical protein
MRRISPTNERWKGLMLGFNCAQDELAFSLELKYVRL